MLANGLDLPEAVREAQEYTWQTLQEGVSPRHGPVPAGPPLLGARGSRRARRRARSRRGRPMSVAATEPRAARRRARRRTGPPAAGLYAVTPDDRRHRAPAGARSRRRSPAARTAIQYRNKSARPRCGASRRRARARVRAAAARCSSSTTTRALARDVDADGVHLGEDDGDLGARARDRRRASASIGVSCYDDLARAKRARRAGRRLRRVRQLLPVARRSPARGAPTSRCFARAKSLGVPVVAIGGITADNARAAGRGGRRRASP